MTPHPKFEEEQEAARLKLAEKRLADAYAAHCATPCSVRSMAILNASKSAVSIGSLKVKLK